MLATFVQPDYPNQAGNGTEYPLAIDAAVAVLAQLAASFAPHENSPQAMNVVVDAGRLWDGSNLVDVAQQVTATITAPAAGMLRRDRVVIDRVTGAAEVVTGTEVASNPQLPAIPAGKLPCCQVGTDTDPLDENTAQLINNMLADERAAFAPAEYPDAPSGYLALGPLYINDECMEEGGWDAASSVSPGTWENVGPTGSGATNIWTALDNVPSWAVALRLRVKGRVNTNSASGASAYSYVRKNGSSATPSATVVDIFERSDGAINVQGDDTAEVIVPIDAARIFDVFYQATGTATNLMQFHLVGWYPARRA